MVKKFLRKRSKRMPCKRRYKIEKKVREHTRKQKKEARKKAVRSGGHKKENIVVPAEAPFKAMVLQEAAEAKRQEEELRKLRREELKRERMTGNAAVNPMENVLDDEAVLPGPSVEEREQRPPETQATQTTRRAAARDFQAVVQSADVILQVLDARDPAGTRSPELESHISQSGAKRTVLVLNKADLVPSEVLGKWLRHFRKEMPAIAFKSSTQSQQKRLAQRKGGANLEAKRSTAACVGADTLMALLGNYTRNKGIRGAITVGVVGMPNVGKSSVINSLKRSRVCSVGATAGVTKHMQTVQLDSKIRLLDSPGIVFACGPAGDAQVALRNALRLEQLLDPIVPAGAILQRVSGRELQMHYGIGAFSTPHEFLCLLSRRQGRLKRKGVPDVDAAARSLLRDWTGGRIKYYTLPPEEDTVTTIDSALVAQMSAEFDIDAVSKVEQMDMDCLQAPRPSQSIVARPSDTVSPDMTTVEMGDKLSEADGDLLPATLRIDRTGNANKRKRKAENDEVNLDQDELTPRAINKQRKMQFKRLRKARKKQEKEVDALSSKLDSALASFGCGDDSDE